MSLLDDFKKHQENKQKEDSGLNLPETEEDPFADSSFDTFREEGLDTTTNTNPMSGQAQPSEDGSGLRQDVKLILERLDTMKSQLQILQHKIDAIDEKTPSRSRRY